MAEHDMSMVDFSHHIFTYVRTHLQDYIYASSITGSLAMFSFCILLVFAMYERAKHIPFLSTFLWFVVIAHGVTLYLGFLTSPAPSFWASVLFFVLLLITTIFIIWFLGRQAWIVLSTFFTLGLSVARVGVPCVAVGGGLYHLSGATPNGMCSVNLYRVNGVFFAECWRLTIATAPDMVTLYCSDRTHRQLVKVSQTKIAHDLDENALQIVYSSAKKHV